MYAVDTVDNLDKEGKVSKRVLKVRATWVEMAVNERGKFMMGTRQALSPEIEAL